MTSLPTPRILVIRRDNIGDLVCTTPLLRALRQRFPNAWLGALVNSYNAPVLNGNLDLSEVFVYTKGKHRGRNESLFGVFWRRLRMMQKLRQMRIDDILLATPVFQPRMVRLARWLKPKRVIGFGGQANSGLDIALPPSTTSLHEVEEVFRLAQVYSIDGNAPPMRVYAPNCPVNNDRNLRIAIHISARKPSQRWPIDRYVVLMRSLRTQYDASFVLLWSPGSADNPLHPGDDEKANDLLRQLGEGFPVTATATDTLPQLMAALSTCKMVICSDGGAMHLAAGLGLPIVCLFGDSSPTRWRPWGVPYRLLQKESRDVADITVEEVAMAFNELAAPDGIQESSASDLA